MTVTGSPGGLSAARPACAELNRMKVARTACEATRFVAFRAMLVVLPLKRTPEPSKCASALSAQNTWFCARIRPMDKGADWHDLGSIEVLSRQPLQQIRAGGKRIALSFQNGQFGAISGVCNHAGGPLGVGQLEGELVVCPWH